MKRLRWVLLLLCLFVVGGGLLLMTLKVPVLQLENADRPRAMRVRITPGESFSIYYIHPVYEEPVVEEYEARVDKIILKGMRTSSPVIAEQYGFYSSMVFYPINEKLGALFLRVAPGAGQGLIIRDRKIYLSEIGGRGERILLSVRSVHLSDYLLSRGSFLFQKSSWTLPWISPKS